MAIRLQKNIEDVLVCKDLAITGGAGVRAGTYVSTIAVGEAAVFSPGGVILNSTTVLTVPSFKIGYMSTNGELVLSDSIDPTTITNYKGKINAAATEQVDYVGYNGTSGTIQVINSNDYLLRLWFSGDTYKSFEEALLKYGVYRSDSSATGTEIAAGLALNLYNNTKGETEYRVRVERVSNGTLLSLGTSVDTVTFTKGSKFFTATDIDDATANAALAVGDVIVIGTTTTSPRYVITAIDAATNIGTLDVPFAGEDYSAVDTNFKRIAAAGVDALTWGLKLTGIAKTWALGKFPYNKVMWETSMEGFGTTEVTKSVKAYRGVGTPEQIAEAEWFAQGNEGGDALYRTRGGAPAYTPRKDSESAHYYSILTFNHKHVQHEDLGGTVTSPKSVFIALNAGGTAGAGVSATSLVTGEVTSVLTVLDAAVVGAKTGTAQIANV